MLILNPSAVWTFSPPAFIVFPLRSLKNLPSAFFSEELWITCVWTEPRLRDTPVRVSRNPHIRVISLPLHVNKTNLASRSFLFLFWATGLKMSVCSYESEKSWLSKRCGGVTGGSGTRGRRGSEITCCLSLPLALSLCAVTSLSGSVHTPALAPCLFTHALGFMVHTHIMSVVAD